MSGTSEGKTTVTKIYPFWGTFKGFFDVTKAVDTPFSAVTLFALGLLSLVVGFAAYLHMSGHGAGAPVLPLAGLAAVAVLAERQSVRIGPNTQMSIAALPILFVAVVYGPLEAMFVGGASVLLDFGRPFTRWVIWTCSRAITAGAAGLAVLVAPLDVTSFGGIVGAVVIAALTEAVLDVLFNALTVRLRRSGSFTELVVAMGRLLLSTIPLYTPLVAALIYAYQTLSSWSIVLFFVPALAAQRLLVLYQEQRELAEDLRSVNVRLERANFSFATALVTALDARDRYTAGHSAAVAVYARDIAEKLELPEHQQQIAHLCGLLHDIGKVGVPAGVLEKTGPLTVEERRQIEQHVTIGERILGHVEDYAEIARIIRHHHERLDGEGYPDGLPGHKIPLISRIIGVADAYNAMTSGRPYRDALASEIACARLQEASGAQFDPVIVSAFDELLNDATDAYRSGARADFALEAQQHPALRSLPVVVAA